MRVEFQENLGELDSQGIAYTGVTTFVHQKFNLIIAGSLSFFPKIVVSKMKKQSIVCISKLNLRLPQCKKPPKK